MVNIKNLHIIVLAALLVQHAPAAAFTFPDFFWIGYISQSLWKRLPSLSSFKYITKTKGEERFKLYTGKMQERYATMQNNMNQQHKEKMIHIEEEVEKVQESNNLIFEQQNNELIGLKNDTILLDSALNNNSITINNINENIKNISNLNKQTKQHLTHLDLNAQKTEILFRKNQYENEKVKQHGNHAYKKYNSLKNKHLRVRELNNELQEELNNAIKENKVAQEHITTLLQESKKKQNTINILKKYIQIHRIIKDDGVIAEPVTLSILALNNPNIIQKNFSFPQNNIN